MLHKFGFFCRFSMPCLSKLATCLTDLHLQQSPLMGHIVNILSQRLSSIDDPRVLTTLMISVANLASPKLRDALINKADQLLDPTNTSTFNDSRRVVQFLRSIRNIHRPLLEKCNKIISQHIHTMDVDDISIIAGMYLFLQISTFDFRLAIKKRLHELVDSCNDPLSFTKLFLCLAPIASEETIERLEELAFLWVDDLDVQQTVGMVETLDSIRSKNHALLQRFASAIECSLSLYKPLEVARVTQSLYQLHYKNPELFKKLRQVNIHLLRKTVIPHEVTALVRALSLMPYSRLEEDVIIRVEAMVSQCSFTNLNTLASAIGKWMRKDESYSTNARSRYVSLLQDMTNCGLKKLQAIDRLDLLLDEVKPISGDWFEETLVEETVVILHRMIDQINWANLPDLGLFLTRINHLCPLLMERIASLAIKDIDKIHPSGIYNIMLPFSTMNYHSVQVDEMFDVCIQRITRTISFFDPHLLVYIVNLMANADYFPEELVRKIFSVDFLAKMDAQLETLSDVLNIRARIRLRDLNRNVCIQCPDLQVPWFHNDFCQEMLKKNNIFLSPAQQQIHTLLAEVLGGIEYVQAAVVTPYFYTIDFECILDKNMQPLPYSEPSTLLGEEVQWGKASPVNMEDKLPPGAQRVAVDFLGRRSFTKNVSHCLGEIAVKKRHLEILGYRVVQIPHFEWNSMELSTNDAWKEYLRKKLFSEPSA
ncbi:FAST kinase domain-containing protein 1, mitochondrial [Morone saxatilis]|uniref:FAST kinase domain-containing protein 1, mitochondrial n=1 Tax=Morone saxatilis TaxID=34816 RepID=UPI0015E2441A|nr:FAST kinase domain-containing protein 1, mitochondrial [Morone saxatilis]